MNILEYSLLKVNDYNLTVGSLIKVVVIFMITWLLIYALSRFISRFFTTKNLDQGRMHSLIQLIKYFFWVIGIVFMLDSIGVEVTFLMAGSAALLVGLGLGLQQIFQDLVSGIFILLEGTIRVDDVIELDGLVGKILSINLRTSSVLTRDGIIIIVPNHKFIVDTIINWSHNAIATRFKVKVGVAYGSDVELVRTLLVESAVEHPDCLTKETLEDKHPIARFVDFGESSLDFELYFWSNNIFYIESTKSDLRFSIDRKFRDHKVTIPFPQRDVHVKEIKNSRVDH